MTVRRGFLLGLLLTTGWMLPAGVAVLARPVSRHIAFGRLR